jgi:hypothetical protein
VPDSRAQPAVERLFQYFNTASVLVTRVTGALREVAA